MMENQSDKSTSSIKRVASVLIVLDAAAWVGFGAAAAAGLIPGLPDGLVRWEMAGLAIAAGGAMLLLYMISKKREWATFLLMGLLALISLLSLTDQVGLFDWIAYAVNLAALVLLIIDHRQGG